MNAEPVERDVLDETIEAGRQTDPNPRLPRRLNLKGDRRCAPLQLGKDGGIGLADAGLGNERPDPGAALGQAGNRPRVVLVVGRIQRRNGNAVRRRAGQIGRRAALQRPLDQRFPVTTRRRRERVQGLSGLGQM